MDLRLFSNCSLDEYCYECAGLKNVKRFDGTAVDGKNHVICDCNRLERDTALGAWKKCCAMLSRWCVKIFVDISFVVRMFVRREQELCFCSRLQGASSPGTRDLERNLEVQ